MKKSRLKRKTPLRSANHERRARETERVYGPVKRRIWVRSLPCSVPGCQSRDMVQAHVSPAEGCPSGMSRKHDYEQIIPLCWRHHKELHQAGQHTFDRRHGIDTALQAIVIAMRWRERDET